MFRGLMAKVEQALGRGKIDDDFYEELEEALLAADTHIVTTEQIITELRQRVARERITSPAGVQLALQDLIYQRFEGGRTEPLRQGEPGPTVYLFVGVNGVGKTTTIGKLAARLKSLNRSVLLASGDTFRAAAIDQLEIWAQRAGVEIVRAQPGSDPAAVIFDAITAARARGIQYVLADTAGRQHTKGNLMHELQKVVKVAEKGLGRKPDEVLLVLDANTGQNAIRQAEEFLAAVGVTGMVLTKLDGTARGGALIGVHERFSVPIKLIGVGERIEDLRDFKPELFAEQLFR